MPIQIGNTDIQQLLNINIMQTKKAKFLKVNVYDFVKGLVVSVATYVSGIVAWGLSSLTNEGFFTFKTVWTAAILAAIGYMLKQFLTNSKGKILQPEASEADPKDPPPGTVSKDAKVSETDPKDPPPGKPE